MADVLGCEAGQHEGLSDFQSVSGNESQPQSTRAMEHKEMENTFHELLPRPQTVAVAFIFLGASPVSWGTMNPVSRLLLGKESMPDPVQVCS